MHKKINKKYFHTVIPVRNLVNKKYFQTKIKGTKKGELRHMIIITLNNVSDNKIATNNSQQ